MIASQRGLNPALAARMGASIKLLLPITKPICRRALSRQQQQLPGTGSASGIDGPRTAGETAGQQQLYEQGSLGAQGITAASQLENAKSCRTSLYWWSDFWRRVCRCRCHDRSELTGLEFWRASQTVARILLQTIKFLRCCLLAEIVVPNSKAHDPVESESLHWTIFLGHKEEKKRNQLWRCAWQRAEKKAA